MPQSAVGFLVDQILSVIHEHLRVSREFCLLGWQAKSQSVSASGITNNLRVIQHAYHFWYAVVSVLKCYAVA